MIIIVKMRAIVDFMKIYDLAIPLKDSDQEDIKEDYVGYSAIALFSTFAFKTTPASAKFSVPGFPISPNLNSLITQITRI